MRDLVIVDSAARAAVLLDPERRRLLEALADRPDSAAGLARRLGEKRQRLNYHLRALEAAGFLEVAAAKVHGGLAERVFRPAARRFLIDPAIAGRFGTGLPADRRSAGYLIAIAARTVHEVGRLEAGRNEGDGVAAPALDAVVGLGSADELAEFAGALSAAIAEVVGRYHRPVGAGARFRLVAGIHPAPEPIFKK